LIRARNPCDEPLLHDPSPKFGGCVAPRAALKLEKPLLSASPDSANPAPKGLRMSVATVLRLEDYRGKRAQRIRLADRMYSADPKRLAIFRHLSEVADLCDADRAAIVWVDEYGPGSVHAHVVLDHLADRPRRFFSAEPLRRAWELGVPAAVDVPADPQSSIPTTFAISLGSDGMRAWFLVAESSAGRPVLHEAVRDRVMFLAGECAAVILHRELGSMLPDGEEAVEGGFAGWPVLQDLEGRESDVDVGTRIAQRFVVGRLARMLVDDDFEFAPERMAEQVRRARSELPKTWDRNDAEVDEWYQVLDSLERGTLDELADRLIVLGDLVERKGHEHGALEMYSCAYEIATAVRAPRAAAEAARYSGGLLRRRASWKEAETKLVAAREIAELAGLPDVAARSMVGLSLMCQDVGNMPAARAGLRDSLLVAEQSGDRDTIAMVHHSFMGIEQLSGNLAASLDHGWVAVATYESEERRTRCMAGLAASLTDCGDRDAAEDAWAFVAHTSKDTYYQIYAYDALGHLAALRGDRVGFEKHSEQCDALGWALKPGFASAEILYHRGLSHRALGDLRQAEEWLRHTVSFAEEHSHNQILFRAEEALRSLAAEEQTSPEVQVRSSPAAPLEVREGLRAMRQELVSAES